MILFMVYFIHLIVHVFLIFTFYVYFFQMFKFIFLNTKKVPNIQDIYKRFKKLIGDVSMNYLPKAPYACKVVV